MHEYRRQLQNKLESKPLGLVGGVRGPRCGGTLEFDMAVPAIGCHFPWDDHFGSGNGSCVHAELLSRQMGTRLNGGQRCGSTAFAEAETVRSSSQRQSTIQNRKRCAPENNSFRTTNQAL